MTSLANLIEYYREHGTTPSLFIDDIPAIFLQNALDIDLPGGFRLEGVDDTGSEQVLYRVTNRFLDVGNFSGASEGDRLVLKNYGFINRANSGER
ncbi:hypothetical protein KKF34_07460 [Myxococcota bacterium]|nr:hypothetical protein [Myxococcota bacterium]MBU1382891.1 hypothetical protein [Myxococcota bacterium]MBU1496697.1 hypothetical protein [Myxococcota bacterium]